MPLRKSRQRADSDRQRAVARIDMARDPQFLARHAHGDKQHVGSQFCDPVDYALFLGSREIAVMDDHEIVLNGEGRQFDRRGLGV